jgi:hypothetical protein
MTLVTLAILMPVLLIYTGKMPVKLQISSLFKFLRVLIFNLHRPTNLLYLFTLVKPVLSDREQSITVTLEGGACSSQGQRQFEYRCGNQSIRKPRYGGRCK